MTVSISTINGGHMEDVNKDSMIPIPADMPQMREALEAATKAQAERDDALEWGGGRYLDANMWKRRAETAERELDVVREELDRFGVPSNGLRGQELSLFDRIKYLTDEATFWTLVADGINHDPRCPTHFLGDPDRAPCMRCERDGLRRACERLERSRDSYSTGQPAIVPPERGIEASISVGLSPLEEVKATFDEVINKISKDPE